MEVIVLDDSSDASSESEMASASTTPSTSPALRRRSAQSVGYADAVEAALAMAAALETKEPGASRSSAKKKEKKAPHAPPLLSAKTKKLLTKQQRGRRRPQQTAARPRVKGRGPSASHRRRDMSRPAESSRSGARSSSLSSSSGSDSSSSLSSESRRRPRFGAHMPRRSSSATSEQAGSSGRRRSLGGGRQQVESRRHASAGVAAAAAKSKQPAEVVDLLSSSSSSSSDSSVGGRARSSSLSTSSDNESLTRTGKNRLVLNDRALGRRKPRRDTLSGQHAKSVEAVVRPQITAHANKRTTGKALAAAPAVHEGKRKRVLPQMRRESPGGAKKRGRAPEGLLMKKLKKKKLVVGSRGNRDSVSKSTTATQNAPVSLISSASSASSSPASSPRPVPARKSVTASATASHSASQAREGEMDAYGRYHCRKSVPASAKTPPDKGSSVSPISSSTSSSAVSASSLPSPSPTASPRKKRRVLAYFDTDHMALDDLQAQERELAWIRAQHKQTQNQSCPSKPVAQKRKTCREVIYLDDHSDANSAAHSEELAHSDGQQGQSKEKVKHSAAADQTPPLVSRNAMLHPTSYRGIFFDEAPPNVLSLGGHAWGAPFVSDCDHPLTFYDETDTLASHCSILESFGKPTQCISSVYPSEAAKPQSEVTRCVSSLVTAHLPIIRRYHRRKVQAILTEARQKIAADQVALKKHKRSQRVRTSHLLSRSPAEKLAVKQLKAVQHTCSRNSGGVSFQIGRGDSFVREKTVSSLIQLNRVKEIRPLRTYTTSIGLRANYRVDDDPIQRYTASTRPSGTDDGNGSGELAKKHGLRIGNVADEEVAEFVLRLVVGRLGDSEQVFHALKSELDFSQAYTAYGELKKLHDSRQRASARLDRVEKLCHDGERSSDPDVAAIVNLMEQSSLSKASRAKALSRRLQPPIRNLESSIVDSLLDGATAGLAAVDLRATNSYNELVDVYCGSFCRVCYRYACHEHGGDHPLPARRVDPVYPRVRLMVRTVPSSDRSGGEVAASDEDVVCLDSEANVGVAGARDSSGRDEAASNASKVQIGVEECDMDMSDDGSGRPQLVRRRRQRDTMADPSEYVDASHVSRMAAKMRSFLSTGSACSKLCWKNGDRVTGSAQRSTLPAAELGVVRKLRETMGDNSCLLAAVVGSASCIELHELIAKEECGDAAGGVGRSGRRVRNWKQGRRSGGSNHELLQRARNQRLQDRGTENHEYQPCMHEGMCDSTGCSCMKRDHMCEKACACSRDCPNRFEGCSCSSGECRTTRCPCFTALRECNPDVCVSCGASELAVSMAIDAASGGRDKRSICGNVNVIRSNHKRLGMSFSLIHGYGMFAREAISATDFVYEYAGAMLSQDEAERRGLIYDKRETSYLFDLNEDAVLDALRCGNKSKFINHEGDTPNCTGKVVSVSGVHHITVWALRDIAVGEELVFDYGYKRSVGPDWSQC
ncbi:Histone-lysine N-methyltransferase ezh1 [Phytophthora pseudosyringae]|uniref:Histone-lysine N-methyltransferase ezh1 n=1 Tax=Phytophthora pseudosyringae TaxID=221518 RepID=A0A8T1V442_9STRA|nr:Histone-lysine N-methyltransferase ezh1 [Phytophthora pseudosyringae]